MTPDADRRTYLLFRLGEEGYALPVEVVTGVVRFVEPTPVPRAPRSVIGVVNLRGRVLPLVDLKVRFGSEAFSAGPHSRIVVAEGASGPVGVVVDTVTEIATFSEEEIRPVPDWVVVADTALAFLGMVERSDGLVMLLDPEFATCAKEFGAAQGAIEAAGKEGFHV